MGSIRGELGIGVVELLARQMVRNRFELTRRCFISLRICARVPQVRRGIITRHTLAVLANESVIVGRMRKALLRNKLGPVRSLGIVNGNTLPIKIEARKTRFFAYQVDQSGLARIQR